MRWLFLSIILFLSFAVQAQNSLLEQQTKKQVRHYLNAINNNRDTDINLWALAEISQDKPKIRKYIAEYSNSQKYVHSVLSAFEDTTLSYSGRLIQLSFAAESPFLLVAGLLEEPDTKLRQQTANRYKQEVGYNDSQTEADYLKLVEALLAKQPVTPAVLPAGYFHPLHYILFFNWEVMDANIFSEEYLATAEEHWAFPNQQSLNHALGVAALFRIYYLQYQYAETNRLYRPLVNNELFPNTTKKLSILRALHYSMYQLGYYNRIINIIRNHSLPLANYLNQQELALKLNIDLGLSLYEIGKIDESKNIYLQLQKEIENGTLNISKGRVYNNLAINYWISGEFDRYLDLQFKALQEAEKEGIYDLRLDIFENLFIYYRTNKDFTSAQQYLAKAQELAEEKKQNEDLAQLAYYQGQLYWEAESDLDRAMDSFDQALSLISYENNYQFYQNILLEKSRIFENQKEYTKAQPIYSRMVHKAQQRKDLLHGYYAAFSKANIHIALGEMDSARVMLDTLETKNLDALDFYQLVKAKTVQARYRQATGNLDGGIELLQPVINQIVQRSRSSGDLETGFWQIEPEYLDAFEKFANLLIETGQPEEAVETLDRLKTINDAALYQNPLVRAKILNEKELSDYKRFTENLDVLRKQLLTSDGKKQAAIQQQIDQKSAQKSALDRKITANANPEPVSVDEVQRQMNARQRVLHITELNDTYYLATISRNDVAFKKIPITQDMRSHLEETITEIAAGKTNLTKLYPISKLLAIQDLPDHIEKLTIIPDSYLYQLPLDILPVEEPSGASSYGDAVYLIERYRTNYMTSLNDFKSAPSDVSYAFDYAGFGVSQFEDQRTSLLPLPQAKEEINAISNQLTALKNKKTYINSEATEQAFRSSAPKAKILHLATHSEVSGRDPMFSSIYLSRTDEEADERFPGRIFAYELFELKLQNDLIMLNSCESGSGSYLQGTGVVGISRALRFAGAKSLVLNLWSVNDMMASEFAVKFYEGINKGQTKPEALRNAKLHFLKNKNANPHYWGAYMLLGNEQAIVQPNRFVQNMVATSFLIFFFSLAIASSVLEIRRRKKRRSEDNHSLN